MPEERANWYVLRVVSGKELALALRIQGLCHAVYLPLYKEPSGRRDRVKMLSKPLFSGYLFAKFRYDTRHAILPIANIIDLLRFGGMVATLSDDEIALIRECEAAGVKPTVWKPGTRVECEFAGQHVDALLVSDDGEEFVQIEFKMLGRVIRRPVRREGVRAA